jgi:DUF1680 family protein
VLRTIAEAGSYAYSKSDDAVWVNLYGGSRLSTTLRGHSLKLSQHTNYPWDGRVRMTIDECPSTEFSLKLRIPGWAEGEKIQVNGSAVDAKTTPGSYAQIRRSWKAGDVVELRLPMSVQLIEANPLVEETRNQVAIKRGPIVYCLESPDLPKDVRVSDVSIRSDARTSARYDGDLLGGVTVIEAPVIAKSSGDWDGKLYRTLGDGKEREIKARFIPYYAWANRGQSEMSVWIPVR